MCVLWEYQPFLIHQRALLPDIINSKLDFLYNLLPVSCSCGDFFLKFQGLVMAWKSSLNLLLLPSGPSYSLQTILLSDLVGCDSLLQIVMAV
jgi:hypothetical protein